MARKLNRYGSRNGSVNGGVLPFLGAGNSTKVVKMDVSPAFIEFLEKLRDFEYLIEQGDYFKAAIIGGDIQMTLDQFDPRLYFPATLSRFVELFHEHGEQLAEHVRDRQSFRWKSHLQFYQVDRAAFVRGRQPK